ncbi:MAG: proline--tRNA ligase [Candidatus Aenigmarchaeota archaeon]|nr:proline--tRNA ligase [Candidatus Aenigmarchaeota archaeon]
MSKKQKREKESDLGITVKKSEDFSEWYTQVIQKAELADYTTVSGCMVLRPWAYAIWEKIQAYVDEKIKALGHKNVYFPMFIPESLLKKEAEHVEGFVPEVAWVTHAGNEKLKERLAVRPTSETIMYESYSKWVRSWRDLPLLLNQWCNVVRWEFKHPRPFLRTREFLWQEGHTVHATKEDADKEAMTILLDVYTKLIEDELAIAILNGKKTENEKFPGALYTTTMEAVMPDGKALQMGTSHNLGQNFAKAFGITFLDKDEKRKTAWQTSWGVTTRLIGAIIMAHGDDKGLVLPPKIAPTQAVVVPILFDKTKKEVLREAEKIKESLENAGISTHLDDRDAYSAGFKFNEWELKGVPLRIEIGPRDVENKQVVLVRRDTGKKNIVKLSSLAKDAKKALDEMQKELLAKSKKSLDEKIKIAKDYNEIKKIIDSAMIAKISWCEGAKCEEKIKEDTGATMRAIPFDENVKAGAKCAVCGKNAKKVVYVGKSY